MKVAIKNKSSFLYDLLKNIYHSTPYYKRKAQSTRELDKVKRDEALDEQARLMSKVFDDEYVVRNGNFKGMKYIKKSSGSALLPKIIGSYEEPIQGWVKEVIEIKKYKFILDIGCAEGYYAVGFASRLPNSQIIAYDVDKKARDSLCELIAINGVQNVEVKELCTYKELNSKSEKNTLIFCDIEGYEKELLDPSKAPNLKFADLIVESHDCFVENVTEELINRFYETHCIRIVVDYPFRIKKYSSSKEMSIEEFNYIVDERRPKHMKFIYMESKYGES